MELTGKQLKDIWNINVKHALYSERGNWYSILKHFPGALFDKNGYIIFSTEEEFRNNTFLNIKKQLNIPKGICNIPGYIKIIEEGNIQEISKEIKVEKNVKIPNGNTKIKRKSSNLKRIIRDTSVTKFVKKLYNNHCQICGKTIELSFDYYSEAHHIIPLSKNGPDTINNVICVCPNHHIQLDYGAIKIEKINLKKQHKIRDKYIEFHNSKIYVKGYGT